MSLELVTQHLAMGNNSGSAEMAGGAVDTKIDNTAAENVAEGASAAGGESAGTDNTDGGQQASESNNNTAVVENQFDWGKLAETSGGLVKDEESFKTILSKVGSVDEMSAKLNQLESNQFKPANTFVEKLNKMVLDGANQDSVYAFMKLNQVGDLNTMDPREVLVSKEMLLNGASREVAEFAVDTAYDSTGLEEGSIEQKALLHKQSVDSKTAIKELEGYRAELTHVSNPEKEAAEQARLQSISDETNRMSFVKQEAPKIATAFNGKLSIKTGEDSVFEHSYIDSFKNSIETTFVEFFDKTKLPLTDENLVKFANFAEQKYFNENKEAIYKDMKNKLESSIREEFASKYENRLNIGEQSNSTVNQSGGAVNQRQVQDEAAKFMGFRS